MSLSLAAGLLIGCGGGDSAEVVPEETVDVSVGQAEVKGKTSSGKRSVSTGGGGSGSNAAVQSALSKVEDALDAGNYSAAVDIVLKTRMDPADQRVAYGMVTDEITDAMARGDANAAKAYQTMNQVRLMRQGQR
ncbi:MAG TPA: hypothetical protein DDW77_06555 [Verrucomicrobiales bacterium]|nr:hypothetical protein [Verrucomicrobiales bacterium]